VFWLSLAVFLLSLTIFWFSLRAVWNINFIQKQNGAFMA
jgi:hypothetical protein